MSEYSPSLNVGQAVARLRAEAGVTQAALAAKSGLDQSRISRIEKGEVSSSPEVDRVFLALDALGVEKAKQFISYAKHEWRHIEPPSFWNPDRTSLEFAESTLKSVAQFVGQEDRPWPLRRQIEKHQESLLRAANFLGRLNHNIAFIGDIGVGKSTAISFAFDLLVPPSSSEKTINRPVLETGAGGTTICEVHIKSGPEFGVSLVPLADSEIRQFVADFCASKWSLNTGEQRESSETLTVSQEMERALRNMCGLARRRETVGGKAAYVDPVQALVQSCSSEEELRTRVLGLMGLEDRTRREIWYDSGTRKHPMEWVTETFRAVNNGRLKEVSLPKSIDLLVPNFGRSFGELEIAVIDTKGVDDVAVREDLDARLRDPRTAVVFCTRFNDAPGMSTRVLLQHIRQTFSERLDTGKVSVLALPRAEEARSMKDDVGEQALTDAEGYEFKRMQVSSELHADDLGGVPIHFYNVELDDAETVRTALFEQLTHIRTSVADRLTDLCGAINDIVKNHEAQAVTAAIEEVANRLSTFLKGNRKLGARESLAHTEAINTIRSVRYASTLWASTRRNGEYTGLNILHLVGVGAARDARARSDLWFSALEAFLRSLRADEGLAPALKSIEQISASAIASKRVFLEAVQRGGIEVYREPLGQAPVWSTCAAEWGRGPGFKLRVAAHLEDWFSRNGELKEGLDALVQGLWEQLVIAPLVRLAEESAPDTSDSTGNVVAFPRRSAG